jgi:hypothetical protein
MITYFERPEIEFEQIAQITTICLGCIFTDNHTKETAIQKLKEFWAKYGANRERPIFIDVEFH